MSVQCFASNDSQQLFADFVEPSLSQYGRAMLWMRRDSCALFVTLVLKGVLERAITSPDAFVELLSQSSYRPHLEEQPKHDTTFAGRR
jgi:hypothetical protein